MSATVPDTPSEERLQRLSELVRTKTGLHYPARKHTELMRAVRNAAAELGFAGADDCLEEMLCSACSRSRLDHLIRHLTVGETYFFRNKPVFQAFRDQLVGERMLPSLQPGKRPTVWSAGCCTGEEPYSLAMALEDSPYRKRIDIVGSDINETFLKRAAGGIYSGWSLRETPDDIRNRYFTPLQGSLFQLSERIRSRVEFFIHNLADPASSCPGGLREGLADAIFCRNVLMYFAPEVRERAVNQMVLALTENGWLCLGASETFMVRHPRLRPVRFAGTTFLRKDRTATPATPAGSRTSRPGRTPARGSGRAFAGSAAGWNRPAGERVWGSEPGEGEPQPRSALYRKALELYERGQGEQARRLLLETTELIDDSLLGADCAALLARCLADLGRPGEAEGWCRKAIRGQRLNPGFYYLLGTILQDLERPAEAKDAYRHVLYLDPGCFMAYFMTATICRQENDPVAAGKCLLKLENLLLAESGDAAIPLSGGMNAAGLLETVRAMRHRMRL
jgi:chemotaxis protein methyltransferase CheR